MDEKKISCSRCTFFKDFSGTQFARVFKDKIAGRCMKETRKVDGWPPPVKFPLVESCEYHVPFDPLRNRWEWDENKNKRNIKNHEGLSFQQAIKGLESDPYFFRQVVGDPKKWEKLEKLDFENLGIPKTAANQDPLRDEYLFMMDGKLYKMVTTFRHETGLMKQRIISAYRTDSKKDKEVYEWAKEQRMKGIYFF